MVDRTISPSFFFEGISVTNVLSILSSSIGSRFRLVRDENPVPKSSIDTRTPISFNGARTLRVSSVSAIRVLSVISSVSQSGGTV